MGLFAVLFYLDPIFPYIISWCSCLTDNFNTMKPTSGSGFAFLTLPQLKSRLYLNLNLDLNLNFEDDEAEDEDNQEHPPPCAPL